MLPVFIILAGLVLAGGMAAIFLRNLVHCALALTVTLASLAALYLQLNAHFVGLVQILVYIGAVAILVVFAILLTRGKDQAEQPAFSANWIPGAAIAVVVFALFSGLILTSSAARQAPGPATEVAVRQVGDQLMTTYVLPLEVLGLLLTAALIGAVIIAMQPGNGETDQ